MDHPAAGTVSSRPAWTRYFVIGAVLLLVLGVVAVVFGPSLMLSYWIHGLNSDDPAERKANETKLIESRSESVEDALRSTIEDDDEAFRVREASARILYRRQRLGTLEQILKGGTVAGKRAVLSVLAAQSHFVADYAEKREWGVADVLRAWLKDVDEPSRSRAVQIALMRSVDLPDIQPEVRAMLVRRPEGDLPAEEQRLQLNGAMGAAVQTKDCASAGAIATLAEKDPDWNVRRRAIQALFELSGGAKPACPDAISKDRLKALVTGALASPDKLVRMSTMTALEQHRPPWLSELRPTFLAILDGNGPGEERRGALTALGLVKDDNLRARLPRYFHDRSADVRSTAVSVAQAFAEGKDVPSGFEGCLIGTVRFETQSAVAFQSALEFLQRLAREWVGLPEALRKEGAGRKPTFREFLAELFRDGQSRGVDREAWAKAWFRWHAGQLGLTEEEVAAALDVEDRFWRAAKASDVAAARAALESFPRKTPGLFCYEEGWLTR